MSEQAARERVAAVGPIGPSDRAGAAEGAEARQPRVPPRRILRLFAPYRSRLAVVFVLIVVSTLIALAPPFLLRQILDVAIPQARPGLLSALAVGLLGLAGLLTASSVSLSYLTLAVGQELMNDLRTAVYRHLQRMSVAFFTRTRNGEVQSRIANDIGAMGTTVTSVATGIMASATSVVATVVAMIALNWQLALASLLMLPVFVRVSRTVGEQRRALVAERQEQLARLATLVEESLSVSGFLLGRLLGRSAALGDTFAQESRTVGELTVRSNMAGRWRQAVVQLVMSAMPTLIYWIAGLTARHGRPAVSIGTLVAFTTLQQALLNPSLQLLQSGIAIRSSMSVFERIFAYLDLPVDIAEPAAPLCLTNPRGWVRFENVHFSYGDRPVLCGIDLDLAPGRHLAVVGATGAGKTTLGHLVPRLHDPTAGRITIDGVDVCALSFATLAELVGVVTQDTYLFHASIRDNLRFARPDATDRDLIQATRAAQIHDLITSLPAGYDTVVGERGHRFSGGEKQRLAIARTLLRDPPVLVLDEATSALDTETEQAVQLALNELTAGRTTISIAHRLSTVRDADEIIVLQAGEIVERGTHAALLALGGRYAALVAAAMARP